MDIVLVVGWLLAHDWYSEKCCRKKDCRPAQPGEVVETDYGYHVRVGSGEWKVKWGDKRIEGSLDGEYHVCLTVYPSLRCLYVRRSGA